MHPTILEKAKVWLGSSFDDQTRQIVQKLIEQNSQDLIDAFYTDIEFGTAGMRGLVGVGSSRMNIYTIQKASQGIANYLLQIKAKPRVVIAYDCRISSREFAKTTALVFAGNGIETVLIPEERPTPFLSFAVRQLKADGGIMITASHNPPEYNGYKVYGEDGAQVSAPQDKAIMQAVQAVQQEEIQCAKSTSPFIIDPAIDLDAQYLAKAKTCLINAQMVASHGAQLKIIYSPLHGTGVTLLPHVLHNAGFTSVDLVAEQKIMDGTFPTAHEPNPESKKALHLACRDLIAHAADIAIATDPDADRVGVALNCQGTIYHVNGNEIALIAFHYLAQHTQLKKPAVITSIVTTPLLKKIANIQKIAYFEVLTGFKYIAALILTWEKNHVGYDFLFGAEESYGYLINAFVRDKDALTASQLIAEIALSAKLQGKTLLDVLLDIYTTYGLVRDATVSKNYAPGSLGMQEIATLMQKLRHNPPKMLLGLPVLEIKDYLHDQSLPPSDVLAFSLANSGRVVIRPSGTEPKVKIYASLDFGKKRCLVEDLIQADKILLQALQELRDGL